MALELVFTECQVLLIFTTILQRRSYYPILQIKKQAERLSFPSPCDCMWQDQDLDLEIFREEVCIGAK